LWMDSREPAISGRSLSRNHRQIPDVRVAL
jgi:hypothetical protein